MTSALAERHAAAARLVAAHRDVLDARPDGAAPPQSLAARGWAPFLLALDDQRLATLERGGVSATWPDDAPSSLAALIDDARGVCDVAPLAPDTVVAASAAQRRHETPRKHAQVDAFAKLLLPLASRAGRVVDIGSGHGHLTRELAARIARPVVGLERDAALAERARALAQGTASSFAVHDVLAGGLALEVGDCVIGLHACGELGDVVVTSAAAVGASVALVGCCLQKQRAPVRRPLAASPADDDALHLPKELLGLSNLSTRDDGVEAPLSQNLAARGRRLALHRLLDAAGVPLRFGAELHGLNRRAAHDDLHALVARAFGHRGLAVPSRGAIDDAAAWAAAHHARARRLSLPRTMLARALEVLIVLDRARFLELRGYAVDIGTAFPASVSARNLALIAVRAGGAPVLASHR